MSVEIALILVLAGLLLGFAVWLVAMEFFVDDEGDDYDDPAGWGV